MKTNTQQLEPLQGEVVLDACLSKYTTWRVGGRAKRLYKPFDVKDLSAFLKSLPADEPLLWLGLGSNVLIRDGGFEGTVIVTQACLNNKQTLEQEVVRVEAGVACAQMARYCARQGLAGAEFWAGIPGTMGGALKMNAGCYGHETWERVLSVETINRQGELILRKPDEFTINYRHVQGHSDEWFVGATFLLKPGEKNQSLNQIKSLLAKRNASQPTGEFNCGSVFRNPPNDFAARLIESCGLKGYTIGGASVSEKHANFIINHGQACAEDIESLIEFIAQTVRAKYNLVLKREVHIIGDKTYS